MCLACSGIKKSDASEKDSPHQTHPLALDIMVKSEKGPGLKPLVMAEFSQG